MLFTFQYGATTTFYQIDDQVPLGQFTFQYGATTTASIEGWLCHFILFTFQYGATTTRQAKKAETVDITIYIPIWSYYYCKCYEIIKVREQIYIPIWSYYYYN